MTEPTPAAIPAILVATDADFLQQAMAQAHAAGLAGEVPVGAVVVKGGQVIATGRNAPIGAHDPTAHAEIVALRAAAAALGNYRLDGCTLYVTLEPCAMCAGAMLHARLDRVVYAAADAKTGAAGSVVNLFANPQLNHQTQVQCATELGANCALYSPASSQLLQQFFLGKRSQQRQTQQQNHPLRDDALRTPEARFDGLPDYPWEAHYTSDLPILAGLRMHYLDEGARDSQQITYLCLHGNPAWSYLYRKMIPVFLQSGARVVAPDWVGFGKSDKPKKEAFHSFNWHRQSLLELVERLDLRNIVLVVQDWGGLLGLTLPMQAAARYRGLLVMNTALATGDIPLSPGFVAWREMCAKNPEYDIARLFMRSDPGIAPAEATAYAAPFPDAGHRAALRAFPPMVPAHPEDDGAATSRQARDFWSNRGAYANGAGWQGQSLMAIGALDPVLGPESMHALQHHITSCPEPLLLPQAGHFVQEQGAQIAQRAVQVFG